jgi:AraC-like DNA-binding protein
MEPFSLFRPELVKGTYYPYIAAYYYTRWEQFRMPFHAHNRAEIMYVLSGQCKVDTDTDSFILKKGDLILLDGNIPHRLIVEDEPCRMLNVEFLFTERQDEPFPSLRELSEEDPALAAFLSERTPFLVLKDATDVPHTLRSLVLKLDDPSPGRDLMVRLLFSQLLLQVARLAAEAREKSFGGQAGLYVRQALQYIHQHYDGDLQVKDIAAAISVHPNYLHRIFKRQTGLSVFGYITRYRIEKAKMLLAQADIPITEIADFVGMNSRQYFSSVFKKQTGSTPAEYRRSFRTTYWPDAGG